MSVAIYCRVSTEGQAEKGTSLDTQADACRRKAHELGYEDLLPPYNDDSSGEYLDRPGLNALRRDIELGIASELIICYDPDRLSRKLHHQLILEDEFKRFEIKLIFVNSENKRDTPEGKLLYHMQGAVAEYEKDKIRERTVRGKLAKARNGQIMPMRTPPYGYAWQDGMLYVNESESALVRNIFAWYLSGQTMREIGTKLIESGVPARLGSWNASTIGNIIKNETYIGKYFYNRRKHERVPDKKTAGGRPSVREKQRPESEHILIEVPAIIDDLTWQRAQIQRGRNTRNSRRNTKLNYLARGGYLHCADCGRVLQNTSYTAGHGENSYRVGVYRCPNLAPRNYSIQKCPSSSVRAEYLDTFIWQDLTAALLQPENVRFIGREDELATKNFEKERERLDVERARLKKEKDKIVALYQKDLLSVEDVERQLGQIKRKEQNLNQQQHILIINEQESPKKAITDENREAIFVRIRPLLTEQGKLSFEEKQFIFQQLMDHVEVYLRSGLVKLRYQGVYNMESEHTYTPGQRRKL